MSERLLNTAALVDLVLLHSNAGISRNRGSNLRMWTLPAPLVTLIALWVRDPWGFLFPEARPG